MWIYLFKQSKITVTPSDFFAYLKYKFICDKMLLKFIFNTGGLF
ncbi:hypothetical protein HMPREF3181_00832 [Parvimonas sp. KA00067]|nr:hypothetical protein HMPREF3181_00832 [Parvimonas sp. KA00067]